MHRVNQSHGETALVRRHPVKRGLQTVFTNMFVLLLREKGEGSPDSKSSTLFLCFCFPHAYLTDLIFSDHSCHYYIVCRRILIIIVVVVVFFESRVDRNTSKKKSCLLFFSHELLLKRSVLLVKRQFCVWGFTFLEGEMSQETGFNIEMCSFTGLLQSRCVFFFFIWQVFTVSSPWFGKKKTTCCLESCFYSNSPQSAHHPITESHCSC